jgi:hypothetical protein
VPRVNGAHGGNSQGGKIMSEYYCHDCAKRIGHHNLWPVYEGNLCKQCHEKLFNPRLHDAAIFQLLDEIKRRSWAFNEEKKS